MGLPTRKYQATPKDVRAIVNGSYPGDPHAVIKSMASTLAKELSPLQKPGRTDDLLNILVRQLEDWLVCDANVALPEEKAAVLPVTMWSPAEVVAKQKLSALTTLYRYDKAGKLYCVKPSAKQNGRMFPARQFVDPVPSLLPHVITELRGVLQFELHAFSLPSKTISTNCRPRKCWRACRLKIEAQYRPHRRDCFRCRRQNGCSGFWRLHGMQEGA